MQSYHSPPRNNPITVTSLSVKQASVASMKQHRDCAGVNTAFDGMSHVGRFLTLLAPRAISRPVFTFVYSNVHQTMMALLVSNNASYVLYNSVTQNLQYLPWERTWT
jgi:hypothetical protein